ncbi:MAG: gene transfer agent family protein [Vicinamibacteria bacterium]|nr:gene transfer agent family protein [Vicinamibacteria bacterium]
MKRKVRRTKALAEAPNRFKGEFGVTVGAQTYSFRYGMNTLVVLEERLGCTTIYELMARLTPTRLSFRDLRVLIQAGLYKHHPDVSEEQAGELMDEMGGVEGTLERIMQALQASFPEPDPAEGADPNAARAAGSGAAS